MADSTVHVVADDRKTGSRVIEALAALDETTVTVDRRSLGEYRVDDGLRVERKRLPDLAASIADGRLFRQASRLVTASRRAVVPRPATWRTAACGARPCRGPSSH